MATTHVAGSSLKLGISFHSFTDEYCSAKWSFEDMMELATHLGGGVEIVGPAHQRGFPRLSPDFERVFRSAVERHGLTPTAYGSYADPFMLPERDLNDDELIEYTLLQLRGAARLGFSVVRVQYFVHRIAERLLPHAERLGVRMGYELHAPMTFEADVTRRLIDQIERLGSPYLGLIPDAGIFAHSVPAFRVDGARAAGIPDALIAEALDAWQKLEPLGSVLSSLEAQGLREEQIVPIEMFFGTLGKSDPEAMVRFMPHIVHFHGKYFGISNGDEPDIRYADIASALIRGGYDGWISSEYEGPNGVCSFDVSLRYQRMLQRHLSAAFNA